MTDLPYDYSRCLRDDCELGMSCLRKLSQGHPTRQVCQEFPGGPDCYAYIGWQGKGADKIDEESEPDFP